MNETTPRNAPDDDEWLDINAVCQVIGGTRPVNPSTYYRGAQAGRYPLPEQRGLNVKRVSRTKLVAALNQLRAKPPPPDEAA
jgi:hypothetical protein